MSETDFKFKVTILGDEAVGKTCLIKKYVYDKFDDLYLLTLGTKITKKSLKLKSPGKEIEVKLVIWDIMGQRDFSRAFSSFFAGSKAGILICDMTRKKTLKSLQNWVEDLFLVTGPIPLLVLGNKNDAEGKVITEEEIKAVAEKYNAPYYFTSAKTGENVERFFYHISKILVEKNSNVTGILDFNQLKKDEMESSTKKRRRKLMQAEELETKSKFIEAKKIYDELEMVDYSKKVEFLANNDETRVDFAFESNNPARKEKDVEAGGRSQQAPLLTDKQRLQILEDRFILGEIDKETYERLKKKYEKTDSPKDM
jgi:Ras-related protein Rab-6A